MDVAVAGEQSSRDIAKEVLLSSKILLTSKQRSVVLLMHGELLRSSAYGACCEKGSLCY